MTTYKKMTQTIQDLESLLAEAKYAEVISEIYVTPEYLARGPALVAQMERLNHQRSQIRSRKQLVVAEKKSIMRQLRMIRSDLGAVMRLNFSKSPLLVALEMQTHYQTVSDEEENETRKPTYDRREVSERDHFARIIENLADMAPDVREAIAEAGWSQAAEAELRDIFALYLQACKTQRSLEGERRSMTAENKEQLAECVRWYRNVRNASRSLRRRRPDLAGLIDQAFPQADKATPAQATNNTPRLLMVKPPATETPQVDGDTQTKEPSNNQIGEQPNQELNNDRHTQTNPQTRNDSKPAESQAAQTDEIQSEMSEVQRRLHQAIIDNGVDPNDPMALLGGTEAVEAMKLRKATAEVEARTPEQAESHQHETIKKTGSKARRAKRSRKRRKAA